MTTSGDGPSAAPTRPAAIDGAAAKKTSAADAAPAARTTSGDGPSTAPARPSAIDGEAAKKTSAAAGALSAERRAAAVAAGVVLRSADDRTALFTQWLAPHLPMVRGLVRRHTYFAGERADDYQTAVLHLLEHLDDLAHFALCLTARRDTAKPHAATANDPTPADEPSAQPTTPIARNFDETRDTVDKSAFCLDEHAPYLYASAAESNESQCGGDETRPASDETLREVNETPPTDDEALRAIDTAAVGFDAMTDADDEALREVNETQREVNETRSGADKESLRGGDETAAEDEASAAAADERQPCADAALEGAEQTPAPLPVTAEEVLRTVEPFNPRPWLAGVTLRLLSTLNHRALRHRETHLTPASADSDELFDPVDPDGELWAVGADSATAGAQRHAAPSRWEETLGAGRERTGGSAGVSTRDAATPRRHGRRRRRAPMPPTSERLSRPRIPMRRLRARKRRQQPGVGPRRRASGRAAQWTTAWNAGTANSRVGVSTARAAADCGTPCGPVRNRRIRPSPIGRCCVPTPRRRSPPSRCATAPSCC